MSTTIDQAFIKQYESDVHHVYQRDGARLRPTVRTKDNVVGTSTTFQKAGKGIATTKARHGVITPMNQTHTAIECTLSDLYAGDFVDRLDETKTNIDERMVIARGGAMALGRKVDNQIITALDGTTQTTVSWVVSSQAAVRNSLLKMVKTLWANDVPNDGQCYGILTPQAWAMAMTVDEFKRADYVGANGLPYVEGAPVPNFIRWMNVLWTMHTDCPSVGTASAKVYVWHKQAIGYASGAFAGNIATNGAVAADITWEGTRAAHWVNHMMSGGAVLIDDTGVIEGAIDDTASLPTS
jgi:hypothetical protein